MTEDVRTPTIMLVAGEPSGDALGGQLIDGLKQLTNGNIRVIGVGGPAMRAGGLQSLFRSTIRP
jgi:lipid-A-disaccharide synthase